MSEVTPEVAAAVDASAENQVVLDGGQVTPVEPADGEQKPVEEVKQEDKKPEEPKKNHDQRRWERLMRERAEFKAKAELLEKMQIQQTAQPQETGEPKRENFPDDISWYNAVRKYDREQILAQVQQPKQPQNNWVAKEEAARSAYSDFDDVMEDARDQGLTIPQAAADAITSSDLGADIQYHLAKNPKEAERLWALANPVDQIRAIGRIEAAIEAKKKAPVKVSAAPKPIAPVRTTDGVAEIDRDKLTDKEWFEMRRKERQKALMGQT